MRRLIICFLKEDTQPANLLSALLEVKGFNIHLLNVSSPLNLGSLSTFDTYILISSSNFIEKSEYLIEHLYTLRASEYPPLIISILLQDIQPYYIKLGKSNRFL